MKSEHWLIKILFANRKLLLSCGALLLLAGCGTKPIATVPSESEAIEIIDVLQQNEISSDKEEVGDEKTRQYRILIREDWLSSGDTYAAAIQILHDHCLPHSLPPAIQEASFIGSPEVERSKVQRQLKINIIGQLRKLPGVTCVDVNFVPPQDQLAALEPYPATAAVTVSYKTPEAAFNEVAVRNLVAGSIPKLQPDKVTVVLSHQPLRPLPQSNKSSLTKIMLIVGAGLIVIVGSVLLIYFLQRRRQTGSMALTESAADDLDEAGTVGS
jgi:type III secretion protein J